MVLVLGDPVKGPKEEARLYGVIPSMCFASSTKVDEMVLVFWNRI
jgi:hypothetical protein